MTGAPNATAVISIVATEATGPGYLQVLPCGSRPGAYSNLNVDRRGQTIANLAIVRLDASGETCVYTQSGAHIVVDLQGYLADGAFNAAPGGCSTPASLRRGTRYPPVGEWRSMSNDLMSCR